MKTPNLIDVPKDSPSRKDRLESFKAQHGIWTHRADMRRKDEPWSALLVPMARAALDGYGDEVKTCLPIELIADYCRLLEEMDLLITGNTEREAIRTLCEKNGITIDQPL